MYGFIHIQEMKFVVLFLQTDPLGEIKFYSLLHIMLFSLYSIYIICNIMDTVWRHVREDVASLLPSLKKNEQSYFQIKI